MRSTLFVLDGAKALLEAVKRVFGRRAIIQRCQVHKKRNVKAHVPLRHQGELARRPQRGGELGRRAGRDADGRAFWGTGDVAEDVVEHERGGVGVERDADGAIAREALVGLRRCLCGGVPQACDARRRSSVG